MIVLSFRTGGIVTAYYWPVKYRILAARALDACTLLLIGASCAFSAAAQGQDHEFYLGDHSSRGLIGPSLPGSWRPFSSDSPWNRPIRRDVRLHPDNDRIMRTVVSEADNIRLANTYMPALWVVNADNMPLRIAQSPNPFDTWDQNLDGFTEVGVPIEASMWGENTADGHIAIVDPFRKLSWEMSRYTGIFDGLVNCTTFNVWDVAGPGVGDPNEGSRWRARGGRGSGFPIIAGLIRPEELEQGEIAHALVFIFSKNRDDWFVYPAARTDGRYRGRRYPMEGMRFQLDPDLSDADFESWGLNREAKIVARALQRYGMYNGDNGGAMTLQFQLLDPDPVKHAAMLEERFPGFARAITRIPSRHFRVVDEGYEPTRGGARTTTVAPLIVPQGGAIEVGDSVTIMARGAGAHIRYTTDGTIPTESSRLYAGPIALSHGVTLIARAFEQNRAPSHPMRAEFWLPSECRGPRQC